MELLNVARCIFLPNVYNAWICKNGNYVPLLYVLLPGKSEVCYTNISLRVLHSSTKHSSICSGGKNGNPTNSDNHFPISHVFSLYPMYTMHGYVKMEIMCHCYMYCYREKVKYVIPTDVVFNISAL
jgi:hypothetical protein